jgi:hypothetical protein
MPRKPRKPLSTTQPSVVRSRKRSDIRRKLARALEIANEAHPYQSTIHIKNIELTNNSGRWASPWIVVARIRFKGEIGYEQLYRILESWHSSRVMAAVDKNRIARFRVIYQDNRKREEYTLAETAPWQMAVARALEECDPTDTETAHPNGAYGSLAARYGIVRNKNGKIISGSLIPSIDIWLSEQIGFRRAEEPKGWAPVFVGKGK